MPSCGEPGLGKPEGVAGRGSRVDSGDMARTRKRAVTVRRIYDAAEAEGYRVLVDRLWPRGVKKTPDLFDEWAKEAAPSPELRRWYGHDPARYAEFERRYRAELRHAPASDAVAALAERAAREPLTLLTATRDVEHSGAHVLAEAIEAART